MEIGYACKLIGVADVQFSSCSMKNCTEERLIGIIENNLECLNRMIDYNIEMGIKLFRISSDIIPFGDHLINEVDWRTLFKDRIEAIGSKIKRAGIRVSMHPGQYTVLNSTKEEVVKKSMGDLMYHCNFLDALSVDNKNKIILHVGGVYGDKESAKERFSMTYRLLPLKVKNRLVIENDDKSFHIEDVLEISKREKIPVIFDNLHHQLNSPKNQRPEIEWIRAAKESWREQDGTQKIHYSQQKIPGLKGAHSDRIQLEAFLDFYDPLLRKGMDVDIMLEVKDKNLSAVKCKNGVNKALKMKYLEEEWARYKYFVLGKSVNLYTEIRQLLKDKSQVPCSAFYELIEKSAMLEESVGSQINAVQHVWGYVNKRASLAEEKRYNKLLQSYRDSGKGLASIKRHLYKMAEVQREEFLLKSLYFFL